MKTYLLNPTVKGGDIFIREGRCMQKASSWVTIWPPITLGVFGALAKKVGMAKLFDGNIENATLEELLDDIKKFAPDLVVVNTGFPSIEEDMRVAKAVKDAFPAIKILAFGVYFTLLDKQSIADYPFLDFAINGEPDETFNELIQLLNQGQNDFSSIKGLYYTDTTGIHINEPRPLIDDIETIPHPDRTLFKNDKYRLPHNNKTFTLINTARGCPFPCIYCIVRPYYGNRVRKHSIKYIIDEIKECHITYGIEEFLFWEEVFALDKQFVSDFCDALVKNKLNIKWAATTRVDTLDEATLRKMKSSGCYLLGLGIESGCQEILDNAKKKQTLEGIRKAVALCKKVKLQTMGHFIFGLPGETKETAEKTIDFMVDLGLDFMQAYCAVPYPKTELGELAHRKGWVTENRWSKYDFGGDCIINNGSLTGQEVTAFREKAFRRFYFRPIFMVKKFFTNISIRQIFQITKFVDWIKSGG